MRKIIILSTVTLFLGILYSCSVINDVIKPDKLGGNQSPIGEVGNSFSISGVNGMSFSDVKISELSSDGISTVDVNMNITNPVLLAIVDALPYSKTVNGNQVSMSLKAKFTDEGVANELNGQMFTMVKYDGKVGDQYSAKANGKTITREIRSKSETDDYPYAFFNIKALEVQSTGLNIPGVKRFVFYFNHRFGFVGLQVELEDGTTPKLTIISKNENS